MYDVVVVGAGPAGATTTRRCALMGLDVLLIEKAHLPRYKACGGGVPTKVLSYLDFPLSSDLIEGEIFGVKVCYGRHSVNVRTPYRLGICTSRDRFDAFLTSKAVEAGGVLHVGETVISVEKTDSGLNVRSNQGVYQARIVVGADGACSVVAKGVRPPFRRERVGIACDAVLPIHEIEVDDLQLAVFDFGAIRYGYGWVFPRQKYIGVGVGARASKFPNPREAFRRFLRDLGVKRDDILPHWHILPAGGYQRRITSDGIMLVGDAAGFVDPLLGGGIEMAVRSGIFAAETAAKAIAMNDCTQTGLKSYPQRCDSTFGRELRVSLVLSLCLHAFPDILIKPFAIDGSLTRWLIDGMFNPMDEDRAATGRWLVVKIPLLMLKAATSA